MSAPITEAHRALSILVSEQTSVTTGAQLIADSEARAKQEEAALWKVSTDAANTALVNMTTAWKSGIVKREQLRAELDDHKAAVRTLNMSNGLLRAEVERLKANSERYERTLLLSGQLHARAEKAEAELANAKELLREIRDHEVNEADEADKFLRDHIPSELSKVRAELATERARLDWLENRDWIHKQLTTGDVEK